MQVLILIVVEDGLVLLLVTELKNVEMVSLNPYCSGRWSRTFKRNVDITTGVS